ncbi:MAG: 6-bladed beta-propeller, partial [Acidobacteria bacterium]
MRSSLILFFLSATSFLFAQPSRVPEIQYQSVPDFLKLPPDLYL